MISKETFIKVIEHIQAQERINDQFSEALDLVCEGWSLYGLKDKYKDALFLVLKEALDDKYDYISWWLYEAADYIVYEKVNDKEKEYDLTQPEALYDFLIHNKEVNNTGECHEQ